MSAQIASAVPTFSPHKYITARITVIQPILYSLPFKLAHRASIQFIRLPIDFIYGFSTFCTNKKLFIPINKDTISFFTMVRRLFPAHIYIPFLIFYIYYNMNFKINQIYNKILFNLSSIFSLYLI